MNINKKINFLETLKYILEGWMPNTIDPCERHSFYVNRMNTYTKFKMDNIDILNELPSEYIDSINELDERAKECLTKLDENKVNDGPSGFIITEFRSIYEELVKNHSFLYKNVYNTVAQNLKKEITTYSEK